MCSRLAKVIDEPELIIDVGANEGQFSSSASIFFPSARIDAFEPIPECFDVLIKNTKSIERITAHRFAIGNDDSPIKFYVNAESQSSSALQTSNLRLDIFPDAYAKEEIIVEQKTLDSFYSNKIQGKNTLLKIDVQGLEEKVLAGSSQILQKIGYVLEASVNPMYEGELTIPEMISFAEIWDFLLSALYPKQITHFKNYIEFDLLFESL